MSGYFLALRPDILRKWMRNCVNISGNACWLNKTKRILSMLTREDPMEEVEYPIELGTEELGMEIADVKAALVQNSHVLAFELEVMEAHRPSRIMTVMYQEFLWEHLLRLMTQKLMDLDEDGRAHAFALRENSTRFKRLLKRHLMTNQGLEFVMPRRRGFPKQFMLIPPYSLWKELQSAKTSIVSCSNQIKEYMDKEIFLMIMAMMRSNHTEYSNVYPIVVDQWMKESICRCLHEMIWSKISESRQSIVTIEQILHLLVAGKNWNISLFSKTLRGVVAFNEMDFSEHNQVTIWNVIGCAINAILGESERTSPWNRIFGRAAWRWQKERTLDPKMSAIRSSNEKNESQWFHAEERLQAIRTALPWLISKEFMVIWKEEFQRE